MKLLLDLSSQITLDGKSYVQFQKVVTEPKVKRKYTFKHKRSPNMTDDKKTFVATLLRQGLSAPLVAQQAGVTVYQVYATKRWLATHP